MIIVTDTYGFVFKPVPSSAAAARCERNRRMHTAFVTATRTVRPQDQDDRREQMRHHRDETDLRMAQCPECAHTCMRALCSRPRNRVRSPESLRANS